MPSTTWYANKDVRVADNGSSLGAGASDYLPVGLYSGYLYRSFIAFNYSFTGIVSITSAVLHVKTSGQFYVAFGSDPDCEVRRCSSSWPEGTSVALSGSNATEWSNQPGTTGTTHTFDVSPGENDWDTCNITTLMQEALAAGVFHGIRLKAVDEGAASDVTEFYAREYGSNDAYITVDYTTNTVPSAPTAMTPTGGTRTGLTPVISFTHVDGDSDPLLDYDLQVSTDSTFASVTHWNIAAQTTGIVGNDVDRTYAGTALSRGTTYYWRARTSASTGELGEGAWSAAQQFVVNQLPTSTVQHPSAAGIVMKMVYTGGSGWTTPRISVEWTFVDPDAGDSQKDYRVYIQNDSAGSPSTDFYDSTKTAGSAQSLVVPTSPTESAYYHVTVETWDQADEKVTIGPRRVRVHWSYQAHRFDTGSTQSGWSLPTLNTTANNGSVTVEYGSDSAANATPSSGWKGTFGEAPPNRYFYYRAWLMVWGSASPTGPVLTKEVLNYSSSTPVPYNWTRSSSTKVIVDVGTFVYGTQSIKLVCDGTTLTCKQTVVVPQNTNMILSGRYKVSGSPEAVARVTSLDGSIVLKSFSVSNGTVDWTRFDTGSFNTGANTSVIVELLSANGASPHACWFDALKLEASSVVTPWTPGFLGAAVVLDAGGLIIDANQGGVMRLKGSTGGSRDTVYLGAKGLDFGGDFSVYSDVAGELNLDAGTGAINGKRPVVNVYTGNATWNKPANLSHIIVEVVGGGGGGGGITASATAGHGSTGSGGGGGGYARKLFTAADLSGDSTYDVTVPAAAAGGNAASGATGGTCSFAGTGITTVQATGGAGGGRGPDRSGINFETSSAGGVGSGGDLNVGGGPGWAGVFDGLHAQGGYGGNSALGGGGQASRADGSSVVGVAGNAYGGGGSGAASDENATNRVGGDGAVGCVIVTEYYGP